MPIWWILINCLTVSAYLNNMRTDRNEKWREELRASLSAKERTAIPRTEMAELDAKWRVNCNREVNVGYSMDQAQLEATRCLDCPDPGCVNGCPVHNDIPGFIKNIARGEIGEAMGVLNRTTVLPAVCGRVCPQEKQCESKCIYNKMKKAPVAIGNLERFVADYERQTGALTDIQVQAEPLPLKVAVIGSGPSGLTFAGDMRRRGYQVTVYEALHFLGGVLKYGIPEFCLPNKVVDNEISKLERMGVEFVKDCYVGKSISYEDLHKAGFKGIYIATGAGKPRFMGVPGENLPGVVTANEYLIRLNLMGPESMGRNMYPLRGKHVAVIGGGNTAIDAVRFALRMGAERAMIIYRRGFDEMPARREEVRHAQEEGVEFIMLANPVEFLADENGMLRAMRVQKMTLGEADESGRRSPVPVEGAIEEIPVDIVVESVGYLPNPPESMPHLDITKQGSIVVDEESGKSSFSAIYAGGDIVRGPSTVILAMGDGRQAARAMHDAFVKAMSEIEL